MCLAGHHRPTFRIRPSPGLTRDEPKCQPQGGYPAAKHTPRTAHSTGLSRWIGGSNSEPSPDKDQTQNLGIFGNNIPFVNLVF